MPNEIELKLRIRREDCTALFRHPALQRRLVGAPLTRRLTSIYFDTPKLALLDAGVSLRVRHMEDRWFQAVKGAGSSVAGLHQRLEWEDMIAGSDPDFSKITDPALTKIFADTSLRAALRPIFVTDVDRTEWQLQLPGGVNLEVSLDDGELIIAQGALWQESSTREAILEVEIELKSGEPSAVFALAQELQADLPLVIENISKAQRGYAYYRKMQPTVTAFRPIPAYPHFPPEKMLKLIAWECVHQLQENSFPALLQNATLGPAAVAQVREAIERLQAVTRQLAWEQLSGQFKSVGHQLTQAALPFLLQTTVVGGLVDISSQLQGAPQHVRDILEGRETQAALLALGTRLTI